MPYENGSPFNLDVDKLSEIAEILLHDPFDTEPPADVQQNAINEAESNGDVVTSQTREEFLAWLEGQDGTILKSC